MRGGTSAAKLCIRFFVDSYAALESVHVLVLVIVFLSMFVFGVPTNGAVAFFAIHE